MQHLIIIHHTVTITRADVGPETTLWGLAKEMGDQVIQFKNSFQTAVEKVTLYFV